jgi:hypothetical protein
MINKKTNEMNEQQLNIKLSLTREALASNYRNKFGWYEDPNCPTNCRECVFKRVEKKRFDDLTTKNRILVKNGLEPVKLNHYLGRQQFYRQNNLPVELNLMIENEIKNSYQNQRQRITYGIVEDKKDDYEQECLNNIEQVKRELRILEVQQQEIEIQRILDKEIEDYRKQYVEYLNTKPLPTLPKSKIKVLGSKIKTQFQQAIKPKELPKPIQNNTFNLLTFFTFLR